LLSTIVGDESGSRFFWELVDTGQAEYAAMWTYDFQGTGIYMSVLCGAPDDTEANLQRMRQILQQIESEGVTEEELQQAKNKICAQVVLQSERPTNRLIAVGSNWLQRHEYQTVRQVVGEFQAVTREGIADLLTAYPPTQQTTVAVGPLRQLSPPA
jgi:predicted Zn-dependent peptidase